MKRPGKLDNTDFRAWATYSEQLENFLLKFQEHVPHSHQRDKDCKLCSQLLEIKSNK